MKTIIQGVSFIALTGAGLVLPTIATAQTTPAASEADSDAIIVTARKREENLQDVPLSITAVTAQAIEEQGLKSIVDLANVTPGLSYRQGFGRNADRPVIRGQSNIQGSPNVAFFVDGVYVTGSITSYNLDNLERVEVIKGPQAALFGRATFAGAINYITRKPDNEFRGKVSGTGGQDELVDLNGYVSGPIIKDRLFVELDGRIYKFGGQYTNALDTSENMGREETRSIGATVRLKPVDSLDIVARVGFSRDQDGPFPISRVNRVFGRSRCRKFCRIMARSIALRRACAQASLAPRRRCVLSPAIAPAVIIVAKSRRRRRSDQTRRCFAKRAFPTRSTAAFSDQACAPTST
jgi:iron complex outermembrane recepter protein